MVNEAVTLINICKNSEFTGLSCVCGENYMTRQITGVHIIDNPDTVRFYRTGEVIMTTGYILQFFSEKEICDLMRHLCERGCSGIIFKVNRFYEKVPEYMIKCATEYDIPIVTMPYKYALADLQTYILRQIFINDYDVQKDIEESLGEENYSDLLTVLLTEKREREFIEKANSFHMDLSLKYFSLLLAGDEEYMHSLDNKIKNYIYDIGAVYYRFVREDKFIYIIGKREVDIEHCPENIAKELRTGVKELGKTPEGSIRIAIGKIADQPMQIKISVDQVQFFNQFMIGKNEGGIITCEKNEMLYFMYKDMKRERLDEIFRCTLMGIVDYDRENGTELIETLEKLIECDWETGEVCRLLYIHRNTLIKRKAKIVDLIKSNMGLDTTAALQLGMFAYNILKYLYKT